MIYSLVSTLSLDSENDNDTYALTTNRDMPVAISCDILRVISLANRADLELLALILFISRQ